MSLSRSTARSLRWRCRCRSLPFALYRAQSFHATSAGATPGHGTTQSSVVDPPSAERCHFPGVMNSTFTPILEFTTPLSAPSLPTYRILNRRGEPSTPSHPPSLHLSDSTALRLYTTMLTVSLLDALMYQAQRQGRLSFYMKSEGEEGIAVGSAAALYPDDVVFAQYREAGVFLARGFSLRDFMAQLFATRDDPGRGRNMPVHYGSRPLNMHTISSPLGTQLPQAAGAAYALKLQHLQAPGNAARRVVACYFGEGAASEGDFHAAMNIAATRGCPVVFICRNNGWAISTPSAEQYRGDGVAGRAAGYGMRAVRVDGNDVVAVREAVAEARRLAVGEAEGREMQPVLVEAMSYRVGHHSTSDDSNRYRAVREVEGWRRRDNPVVRMRKWLEGRRLWSEEKESEEVGRIRGKILDAFNEAEARPKPPLRAMFEDVYKEITEEQEEQIAVLKDIIERYPTEFDIEAFEGGLAGLEWKLEE